MRKRNKMRYEIRKRYKLCKLYKMRERDNAF